MLALPSSAPRLRLTDPDTGYVYKEFAAGEGEEFAVSFIHSVNKSEVSESYELKSDGVYLSGCVYYGFGAGVATEIEEGQTLTYGENGEMIISGIDKKIPRLIYVVGTVSDHVLTFRGESYSLRDLCGRNSEVLFTFE